MLGVGPTPQERGRGCWDRRRGPSRSRRPRGPRRRSSGAGARRRTGARGAGNGPGGCRAGAPRSPVAWKARAPRPAAWGRGGRACGLLGEFSPGLACGFRPGPRPRGPRRREATHRKGPDPHLGVLPAARAFAQIRHGARPLPGGGFGSHSEAPVSHLRRAGRRGATLGAAAAAPGLGWRAGRPLGGRGGGGGGSGSGGSGLAGGLRWRGGSAGSSSRPARLPLSRSSAMAAAAATDKHLTAQAERPPPPPSPPPPQRDEIRPRGWRGEEGGRRAGEWRDWGKGGWEDGRGKRAAAAGTLRSREKRASALPWVGRGEAWKREGATGGEERNRELGKWEGPAGRGGGKGAGPRAGGVS